MGSHIILLQMKLRKILFVLTLLQLIGCTKIEQREFDAGNMVTITAEDLDCLEPATKALEYVFVPGQNRVMPYFYFKTGEYLNIWSEDTTQCFYKLEVSGKEASFKFEGGGFELIEDYDYYALYPSQFKKHSFSAAELTFDGQVQKGNYNVDGLADYDFMASYATAKDGGAFFSCKRINAILRFQLCFPELASADTIKTVYLKSSEQTFALDGTVDIEAFSEAAEASDVEGRLESLTKGTMSDKMELSLGSEGIRVENNQDTLGVFISFFPFDATGVPMEIYAVTNSGKEYKSEIFNFTGPINCNYYRDTLDRKLYCISSEEDYPFGVGEKNYQSFEAALAANPSGNVTINLLKDFTLTSKISVSADQTVVLDLSSHKLSASGVSGDWFTVAAGGSLKIKGPGEVAGWDPTSFLSDGFEAIPSVVSEVQIFTVREKVDVTGTTEGYTEDEK